MGYASSGNLASGNMTISTAPFFQEVPDRSLAGLLPSEDVDSSSPWKALEEGMPSLNRSKEGITSSVQLGYPFVCGLGLTWRHQTIRVSGYCSGRVGYLPLKEPRFVP